MKSKSPLPLLVLIDGSSYLYRAYYALPALSNSKGEPTGAVFGVMNMIKKLLTDSNPKYAAVVFDAKEKTFRHQLYPQYKANRAVMPSDLQQQIKPLHELIAAMGLPLIVIEGVEADDVIATLAIKAAQQNMQVLISTGDKDLTQIVDSNITLINTMHNTKLDVQGVAKKFGVNPCQMIDFLALIGDSSDNIPGVPKVGPKTAAGWLHKYQNLDNIINHADHITGKIGENLRNNLEQLKVSKQLITLKQNINLGFGPQDLQRKACDEQKLIALLKELEFKKWLAEILATSPQKNTENCQVIYSEKEFLRLLDKLKQAPQFAFDLETTGLDVLKAKIVGIAFATTPNEGVYIPVAHDYVGAPKQLARDFVLAKLKPLLEDKNKLKLGHNLKYNMEVLLNYDINLRGMAFDTMLESYVLNSAGKHNLDTLALKYLGVNTIRFEDIAGSGKKQLTFNQIAIEKAAPYAAEDAQIVLKLHEVLWSWLQPLENLAKVLHDIDMPLIKVLAHLERNGVLIDVKLLAKQSKILAKDIHELEEKSFQLAGEEFNLASPKQLREILFSKLKIPSLKKTPAGQASTAEEVLQALALDYPLPKLILQHRSLSKLKSTYVDSLPGQVNAITGRVYTSYNQAVTVTGRLSSTNPNLQNIPVRTEEGRNIRKAFIAEKGKKIIAADYSQIELRIMAHLSQDEKLLQAFSNGEDIHTATAMEVFALSKTGVTRELRRKAKIINFGLLYGMGEFGLAKQLGINPKEARKYIDLYFSRYPKVQEYIQDTRISAQQNGFVETMFGRRIHTPDINSGNLARKNAAIRAAINAPMQGTAADIIKLAMIAIDDWVYVNNFDVKMLMQVHDELVFEIKEQDIKEATAKIKYYMENVIKLAVPIIVSIQAGNNWDEAH